MLTAMLSSDVERAAPNWRILAALGVFPDRKKPTYHARFASEAGTRWPVAEEHFEQPKE